MLIRSVHVYINTKLFKSEYYVIILTGWKVRMCDLIMNAQSVPCFQYGHIEMSSMHTVQTSQRVYGFCQLPTQPYDRYACEVKTRDVFALGPTMHTWGQRDCLITVTHSFKFQRFNKYTYLGYITRSSYKHAECMLRYDFT